MRGRTPAPIRVDIPTIVVVAVGSTVVPTDDPVERINVKKRGKEGDRESIVMSSNLFYLLVDLMYEDNITAISVSLTSISL